MKTLYIDVYFLLNFAVDLLAVYFSLSVIRMETKMSRLLLCALLGACYAVFSIFISDRKIIVYALAFLTMALMATLISKSASFARRIRFIFFFLLFEIILAGSTYFVYYYIKNNRIISRIDINTRAENQNLLIIAIILLLAVGILKLVKAGLGSSTCRVSKTLQISMFGTEFETEALVDSGNLLCDPMTGTPIMLTRKNTVFPKISDGASLYDFPSELRKKIRIIPFHKNHKTTLLYAWKPDKVLVKSNNRYEEISILIALDKEGGDYGGFESLLPYAAIEHVL